jgi:EmrB/QacA subfamily drug resistance transporter
MTAATPDAERTRQGSSWVVSMIVLITGMFMSLLDTSIINVALPTMAGDFGVDVDEIEWVVTAYNLALGVVVPLSGWLADRIGLTRVYLWALIAFSLVSALCGLAWNLESEIAFRILQAVPGGILPVVTLLMVYRIVPRERLGAAMGMYGVGIAVAPAIGPTLGGYLVEYVDWRLVFYINLPIGLAGAVAAYVLLAPMPPTSARRFDAWGFLAIAYGLFALLLACSEGEDWGWTSYRVSALLVSGALSIALFVVIQLEVREPLIDMRVFRHWPFVNSLLLITVLSVGLFTMLIYLPVYMQEGLGIPPLRTGFLLLPEALVIAFCMPIAGLVYDRFGPRWPATIGLAIAAYGTYLLAQVGPSTTEGDIVAWTCVRAVGNGLALMPIFTAGLAAIPQTYASSGTTMNNIAQRIAGSLGVAGLTIVVTQQRDQLIADRSALMQVGDPQLAPFVAQGPSGVLGLYEQLRIEVLGSAYADAFLVMTWLTALGVGLALMMRKPDAPTPGASTPAAARRRAEPEWATPHSDGGDRPRAAEPERAGTA